MTQESQWCGCSQTGKEGLRTSRADGVCNCQAEGQQALYPAGSSISVQVGRQVKLMSQLRGRRNFPLLRGRAVFFILFRPSTDRRKSTDIMKGNLHALIYCLPIQMLIASRYTFTDTPQMFDQIFGHYVAQS